MLALALRNVLLSPSRPGCESCPYLPWIACFAVGRYSLHAALAALKEQSAARGAQQLTDFLLRREFAMTKQM